MELTQLLARVDSIRRVDQVQIRVLGDLLTVASLSFVQSLISTEAVGSAMAQLASPHLVSAAIWLAVLAKSLSWPSNEPHGVVTPQIGLSAGISLFCLSKIAPANRCRNVWF